MEASLVEQNIHKNNNYSQKEGMVHTSASQQIAKLYCTLRNYSVITPTHTNKQQMDQI
jgi:hypothetical protein